MNSDWWNSCTSRQSRNQKTLRELRSVSAQHLALQPSSQKHGVPTMHIMVVFFPTTHSDTEENATHKFHANYREKLHGVISGFDRLVYSDIVRALRYEEEVRSTLCGLQVCHGYFRVDVD